jgi:hypothetical protein
MFSFFTSTSQSNDGKACDGKHSIGKKNLLARSLLKYNIPW